MTSLPDSVARQVEGEAALARLARTVAAALPAHAFIALKGDLGAGKTTFVKAIATAIDIDPGEVISPTFGLIHLHAGHRDGTPVHLVHADLYRLAGLDELRELGWDDCLASRPDAILWAFVEWPERIAAALPDDRLDITIDITSETGRVLTFSTHGSAHRSVIDCLRSPASADQPPVSPIS